MKVTVHLRDITVQVGEELILDNVSCTLPGGKLNALVGPNGAGKTTLLHTLLGFTPFSGKIEFEGISRPRIGYIPQQFQFDRSAPVTVSDFLVAGISRKPVWLGHNAMSRSLITRAVEDVGIAGRLHLRLGDLSSGEFQRVILAHALLRRPDLLLLDEPNTGVDITGAQLFCSLIEQVHKARSMTTVIVTHDLGVVADHARHVIGLNKSVIFEGDCPGMLSGKNLVKLFGPHSSFFAADSLPGQGSTGVGR